MRQIVNLLFLFAWGTISGQEWALSDMLKVKLFEQAVLSPDQQHLLTVIKHPDKDLNLELFLDSKKIADGTSASWSKDSKQIAYIADGQIKIYDLLSKISKTLTHTTLTISSVKWSPTGEEIAFLAGKPFDKSVMTGQDEESKQNQQLYLISKDGNSLKTLTDGSFHISEGIFPAEFAFSPDGKTIICPKMPSANINDWQKTELVKIDVATGTVSNFLPPLSLNPHFSPDGKWVAYIKRASDWYFISDIWIAPTDGGEPKPLAQTADRFLFWGAILGWSEDSQNVYALDYRRTKGEVYTLPISGGPSTLIPLELPTVLDPKISKDLITFIGEDCSRPQEAYIYDLKTNNLRQATHFNEGLPLQAIAKTELIQFKSQDGLEIEALLTSPQTEKPFPLLVICHGGPIGAFKEEFIGAPATYPVATFASQGFGVLQCNIRGSSGYGIPFRKANDSDWGGADFQDVLAGITYLKEQKKIDNSRIGIMGWSYGGYMTAWAITQTNQFKAASVGAGITDLISFAGATDLPDFISGTFGGELWEKWDLYLERSPITHVQNIRTPTLIQHGRDDPRVPMSQSLQLYQALKKLNIPTKIMLAPRTEHDITDIKVMREFAEANLEWFSKYLLKEK